MQKCSGNLKQAPFTRGNFSNHFIPNFVNSVNSAYQILILCDYYENLFYSQMIAYRNPFLVIGLLLYPLKTSENLTSIPPEIIRKPMVL